VSRALVLVVLSAVGVAATLRTAAPVAAVGQAAPDRSTWRWYKGNTHTHTLESDGDSTPDEVTRWYKEHGYQFLVLSDHNVLTPTADLAARHGEAERFLLVPGEEVTDRVQDRPIHVNGLNLRRLITPQGGPSVAAALQRNVDAIVAADGVPHVNHPNFGWAIAPEDLAALERCRLLEIFSGHPLVNNLGGGDRPGMEAVWDRLLTGGRRVYGLAVDDAHYFKRPWDRRAPRPGQGWIVVRAPRLETAALLASLEAGEFYASTGVELDEYAAGAASIGLRVRPLGDTRYRSELIGPGGAVLETRDGASARFELAGRRGYARVVVTDSNGGKAWGQPVFLD
jgi:hypothetical protein